MIDRLTHYTFWTFQKLNYSCSTEADIKRSGPTTFSIWLWQIWREGKNVNEELILNERIEVIATFGSGQNPCVPRRFRRSSGREVDITEIGLCHPVKHRATNRTCI